MMLSNPAAAAAAASLCCCCCTTNSFSSSLPIIPNNNIVILKKTPLSPKPLFSRKLNASLSFSFPHQKCTLGSFFVLGALTNGQKQRGSGTTSVVGMGGSNKEEEEEEDDEEDDDNMFYEEEEEEEEEYGEDGDGGGDDDDVVLPLDNMKKWLKQKPRGFGEGKVYDTSVEDKLLEQIVQGRQAQSLNLNNLKKNPVPLPTKKDRKINKKAGAASSSSEVVAASGIPVRVSNLPKKKNIHRDLKSAFKDVGGIVDIVPAVSGNQKTKDPICRGFAFVYFRTEDAATRFVQLFSRQPVAFGRIQKQIRCEMINQSSSNTPNGESKSSLLASAMQGHLSADLDTDDAFVKETESDFSDSSDIELIARDLEDVSVGSSELKNHNGEEPKIEPGTGPSLKRQHKSRAPKKKSIAKGERKVPKLAVPGSAKRLKIKDKSVLTDVLSKYGLKTALTGEQR